MDFFTGIWDAIDKALIRENRYEFYLSGIGNTLLISLFAVMLGFLIGAFVAVIKQLCSKKRGLGWIAKICDFYVFVIRGTPVLVQLLLINAVLFNYRGANAIVAAVMCFGINSGAYVAEIVRAGIESIDKGQTEAGRSLGLGAGQTMWLIVLPQAIKNILPALGNEFVTVIKESSIVSVIGIADLMFRTNDVIALSYKSLECLAVAALIYFVLTFISSRLVSLAERKLSHGK